MASSFNIALRRIVYRVLLLAAFISSLAGGIINAQIDLELALMSDSVYSQDGGEAPEG